MSLASLLRFRATCAHHFLGNNGGDYKVIEDAVLRVSARLLASFGV